jgi:hypothetical protein
VPALEERPWNTKLSNLNSFRRLIHVAGNGWSFSMQPKPGLASRLQGPTQCWVPNSLSKKRWRADHAASSTSGFSAARGYRSQAQPNKNARGSPRPFGGGFGLGRTDDFRSTPINRHRYRASACRKCANSRRAANFKNLAKLM